MAAAIELGRHGVACTLIDEAPRLGGVVFRGTAREDAPPAYLGNSHRKRATRLHAAFAEVAHMVTARLETRVIGGSDGTHLHLLDARQRLCSVRHGQLLIATGCHERSVPFPGWTLPGVMLLGGMQLQLKRDGVRPSGPVVLAGTGPLLPLVACQLLRAGARVHSVHEAASLASIARQTRALLHRPMQFLEGVGMHAFLKRRGIPFVYGSGIVRANGNAELEQVTVAPYDARWVPDMARAEHLDASTLGVGYGFVPRTRLSRHLGLVHDIGLDGTLHPRRDAWQRSSTPHIHVAGDMAGVLGGDAAQLTGRIAALSMLEQRGVIDGPTALRGRHALQRQLDVIIRFRAGIDRFTACGEGQTALPRADTVVCRCEGVLRRDIDRALMQGVRDMTSLKMRTRVGMGDCQGKTCAPYCSDRLRQALGTDDVGWIHPRFPIDPLPFSALLEPAVPDPQAPDASVPDTPLPASPLPATGVAA